MRVYKVTKKEENLSTLRKISHSSEQWQQTQHMERVQVSARNEVISSNTLTTFPQGGYE